MDSIALGSAIIGIFAILATVWNTHFNSFKENLQDKTTRKDLKNNLKNNFFKRYKKRIKSVLIQLDSLFCEKESEGIFWKLPLKKHFKNYSFHFILAMFYTVFVLIFLWVFGGAGEIGGITLLKEESSPIKRVGIFFLIVLLGFFFYCWVKNMEKIIEKISFFLRNRGVKYSQVISRFLWIVGGVGGGGVVIVE